LVWQKLIASLKVWLEASLNKRLDRSMGACLPQSGGTVFERQVNGQLSRKSVSRNDRWSSLSAWSRKDNISKILNCRL
jgi:hypothetical protein